MIDKVTGGFHWNSAARRIAVDRWRLAAGATHFAMSGFVTPPYREGDPWTIGLTNAEPNVAGPERPGERPISLDDSDLAARLFLAEKKLVIDRFSLGGPQGGIAMAGGLDWSNGPHLRLGASISPAPVSTVLRLWPSFVAAPVRSYLLSHTSDGTVEKGTLRIDFHADDFEMKPAPALVEAKVTGSVEAIGELLSHDALKPYASLSLDTSTLSGQAGGGLEIDMKLGRNTGPEDTTLKVNATVTNFIAERLIGNEKLDAATLTVNVDPSGLRASGQGTMFGAPAAVGIEKLTGKPAEASIGLTLDDA